MQTSSFAAMFDAATRRRDNSFSHDPAFGYNEHQRRSGFHSSKSHHRDRSYSHDADEFASYGDGSFCHDQEGSYARNVED